MLDLVWLIPALPLAGFLILMVFGRRLGEPAAGWLASATVGLSFVVSLIVFAGLLNEPEEEREFTQVLFEWIPVGSLRVDVGFLVDPLSMAMVVFVTGIAALIHVYSIGYMHGDEKFSKFFVYMNLFVFAMLMLVLGDNLVITFLGWEGVGACSYFLIAFWFTREEAAVAGKKAFVTNRIGDFGFMIGIFLTFAALGSVNYLVIDAEAETLATVTATAIALLFFLGAAGKSAQLPLSVWLPDAMAGPTPVSALIHAATMVTAGVYLLCRLAPVLSESTVALNVIVVVGAITALWAATVACAQHDIKRPRVLDRQPARLHGRSRGVSGLRLCDLPHDHPRLLQGPAVPRRRLRHPRPARRAGPAAHGRAPQGHADHRGHVHRRLARDLGHPALRGLLVEGRDPDRVVGEESRALGRHVDRCLLDGVLHEPTRVPHLLRRGALGGRPRRAPRSTVMSSRTSRPPSCGCRSSSSRSPRRPSV